jgi:HAMP domain-containing protein
MAHIASTAAAVLTAHPQLSEKELYEVVRANLAMDDLVYGSCIAFEPFAFKHDRERFAPYAYRGTGGIETIDIGSESYDYTRPEWEWFSRARESDNPIWTEPYFDKDAGNVLMSTYSAPFRIDERFGGVVTVDVRLEDIQDRVGLFDPAEGERFMLLSAGGVFISHPDPELIMKESVQSIAQKYSRPEFLDIFERAKRGDIGVERHIGLERPVVTWMSFAPIPSTGWYFAAGIPEAEAMAFVDEQIRSFAAIMLVGLMVILAIVFVVSIRVTKPIRKLNEAVEKLGSGDFNVRVSGIDSRDEIGAFARAFNIMVKRIQSYLSKPPSKTRDEE